MAGGQTVSEEEEGNQGMFSICGIGGRLSPELREPGGEVCMLINVN